MNNESNIENDTPEQKLARIPEYQKEIKRLQKQNARLVVQHESEIARLEAQHAENIRKLREPAQMIDPVTGEPEPDPEPA